MSITATTHVIVEYVSHIHARDSSGYRTRASACTIASIAAPARSLFSYQPRAYSLPELHHVVLYILAENCTLDTTASRARSHKTLAEQRQHTQLQPAALSIDKMSHTRSTHDERTCSRCARARSLALCRRYRRIRETGTPPAVDYAFLRRHARTHKIMYIHLR